MNLLYYSSEDVPIHILMLLNAAPMQLHDKYLKMWLAYSLDCMLRCVHAHSLWRTHNHMHTWILCMYDTHVLCNPSGKMKSYYALTAPCETARARLYKETHVSSSWIHKCYTVTQSHRWCHLFSFLCCFSFRAYLELWEMYCHSPAGRKPSLTSNILVSFKLSPFLMVSCHCCGVFALHSQECTHPAFKQCVHVTLDLLDLLCDTSFVRDTYCLFSLYGYCFTDNAFMSNKPGTEILSHCISSKNITIQKHNFYGFTHIVTVICGYEQTRLHRGRRSGTADVLFMQIRWRRANSVFILAWILSWVFIRSDRI